MFAEAADERGITEVQFVAALKKLPDLEAALIKDLDPDWGRLRSYRTLEDQLAKLMGNIERLRRELLTNPNEERVGAIKSEMRSRKDGCKKLRAKGVIPAVGPVVFNQMDLDKDRFVSESEAARTFAALGKVYGITKEEMAGFQAKLFKDPADAKGISEQQFVEGLKKLPDLEAALIKDLDPDWGRLRSYRTLEDQLAKLLRNVEVLQGDESKAEELAARKEQAAKMQAKGVVPNPGSCVFFQAAGSETTITQALFSEFLSTVAGPDEEPSTPPDPASWFAKINGGEAITEEAWLNGVQRVPELN